MTILIVVVVLFWVLSCGDVAVAFDFHADSAHGNESDGVNRLDTECPPGTACPTGDCAHCHDTFDSSTCSVNHRMLFNAGFVNQKSGVCMKCHQEVASHQEGGVLYNYDYSRVRGGEETKDCPASIRKQFWFIKYDTRLPRIHCDLTEPIGSAHDLKDIRAYMKNKWGWGGTNTEVNPCGTCHNPHQATKEYPCSKPSSHSGTWEIWGDDPVGSGKNEKMAEYAASLGGVYQPPYKVGWTPEEPKYEWTDADQAPAYNTLCIDCHWFGVDSTRWEHLDSLGWFEENSNNGNRHGARPRNTTAGKGVLKSPYDDEDTNYILMCTDCHEPHGSKNYMLLRTCVNGREGLSIPPFSDPSTPEENQAWITWCEACHTISDPSDHKSWRTCNDVDNLCHYHQTASQFGKF